MNWAHNTIGTPLPSKVTLATGRLKTMEKQRQVEPQTRLNPLQDCNGTRTNRTKTEIIPGHPDGEFADIKSINKEARDTQKLILRETKPNMTEDGTKGWRRKKEQRRQLRKDTISQRTREKQMVQSVQRVATKADRGNGVAKGWQTVSRIQYTMSHLPGQVDSLTVRVEEKQLTPGGRPIHRAKGNKELHYTMGNGRTIRQKHQISRLSGQRGHWHYCQTTTDTKPTTIWQESAIGRPPSCQEGRIKTRQPTSSRKPKRTGQNLDRRSTEALIPPESEKRDPRRWRKWKTSHPLQQQSPDLQLDINNRKTTTRGWLNYDITGDKIRFTIVEKLEHRVVQFAQNPRRDVNHRCNIPNSQKGQRIDYKSLSTKRQRSLAPRWQHILNSSNRRTPDEHHSMATGVSVRPFLEPSHKPLHFEKFNLAPEPRS